MKIFGLFLLLISVNLTVKSQNELLIGNSQNRHENIPFNYAENYSYSQSIFHKDSIELTNSVIKEISFIPDKPIEFDRIIFEIYFGHTSKNKFNSLNDWIPIDTMELVYHNYHFLASDYFQYS